MLMYQMLFRVTDHMIKINMVKNWSHLHDGRVTAPLFEFTMKFSPHHKKYFSQFISHIINIKSDK